MERIADKLDRISDRLNKIDVTLAEQHVSLKEHIRRTELLEGKLEPVETHVARVDGALRLLGVLSLLVGIAAGILKVVG